MFSEYTLYEFEPLDERHRGIVEVSAIKYAQLYRQSITAFILDQAVDLLQA